MIAKQRVLVMDDERIVRESFRRALSEAGYAVRTAESGRDALEALREEPCDVMLADLKMPDMDGLQVTRALSQEFPNVRVVIVTGYPSRETYDEASKLGIVDYLEKPISPERLSAATATALARPWPVAPRFTAATDISLPVAAPESEAPQEEKELAVPVETQTDDSVDHVEPVAQPTVETVVEPAAEPSYFTAEATSETDVSTGTGIALLAMSPLLGLAFVIFLPLIGFAMLFVAVLSAFGITLGLRQD